MYFFYIDESGNRDVKKTDEPYVLTAVGMYENQWRGFNTHLTGMKTNLARQYSPDIAQDQMDVKSNFVTKNPGLETIARFSRFSRMRIFTIYRTLISTSLAMQRCVLWPV